MGSSDGSRTRIIARIFAALLGYQALAIVFYGRSLIFRLSTAHSGWGPDPQIFIWCLVWWPYALAHRLNPFITDVIWAPEGFNLAWSTSIPLQSILAAPITARFGPVVAFNLMNLALPAVTALSAFVLIRHIVGHTWPALFGGYLFGFSSFMVGHQGGGHIVLTAAFLVPVAVYLVLMRFEETISAAAFVSLLTLTLVCQFLLSAEIFATMVFWGTIALGVAYLVWPLFRKRLESIAIAALVSLGCAVFILSPDLFYVLRGSGMGLQPAWSHLNGTDLLELFLPTDVFMLGQLRGLSTMSLRYVQPPTATGGYVGLPVLMVIFAFLKSHWHRTEAKFFLVMIATIYVASLGERLHIGGLTLFGMPWKLFAKLPFLNSASPNRFTIYLHLMVAMIVSIWIAEVHWSAAAKWAVAAVVLVSLLPNLDSSFWVRDLKPQEFFTSDQYRHYLQPGETVLALPFGMNGDEMIWQAQAGNYFRMAEGWTGLLPPRPFQAWPIIDAFVNNVVIPEEPQQLYAFLATHGVSAVVIERDHPNAQRWRALLLSQSAQIQDVDGVIIARPAPGSLDAYRRTTAVEMECREDIARFEQLVDAGDRYLAQGYPLDRLTPLAAQQKGFIPANWVDAHDDGVFVSGGLWLGPWSGRRASVGVNASSGCVEPLLARYRSYADEIYFPYPRPLAQLRSGDLFQRKLVMVFERDALSQVAARGRKAAAAGG